MAVFKTDKRFLGLEIDGVELSWSLSYKKFVKVIQRFVLSQFRSLQRRQCTGFSQLNPYSENSSSTDSDCLNLPLNK